MGKYIRIASLHRHHQKYFCIKTGSDGKESKFEDVPLVEFMYLVFTRMPGESYHRRLTSLLCTCVIYFEC